MSDPTQMTAEELLAAYARNALSPVEVLQAGGSIGITPAKETPPDERRSA